MCEAASGSHHTQTHVFLKIRIPIPPLANPRSALLPPFYPGKNDRLTLTSEQAHALAAHSHCKWPPLSFSFKPNTPSSCSLVDHVELEALFAQYKSLSVEETTVTVAGTPIGGGINKTTFEQCLGPLGMEKNLITERIFAFFDRDRDGIIAFPELVDGLSVLCKGNLDEKIECKWYTCMNQGWSNMVYFLLTADAFNGYDLDDDGYISRDELYWMFKSYFYLSMELVRDVVSAMEDEMMDHYDFPAGQPVSAAFNVPIPTTSTSSGTSNSSDNEDDDDNNDDSSNDGTTDQQDEHRRRRRSPTPTSSTPQKQDLFTTTTAAKSQMDIQTNDGEPIQKQEWEEKFPIMETMAQDAIHEMVNKTFRNMVTRREGYISFDEFKQCVQTDSSIVSWFEALGTVF